MSAFDLLGSLVLDDGRRWGEAALDWQRADAAAVLDLEGPRLHFVTRPRGGSKTSDAAGVAIAALAEQLPAQSRSYGVAADRDQGGLLIDSVAGFVSRTKGLESLLKVETWRVVNRSSGASFEVLAADEASSWGLRPHLVVVDEFAQWGNGAGPRRLWSSVFSALPKVPGARLLVITSAGLPTHWSAKVLESAESRPSRWRVSQVPGPLPWMSEEDLAEQRSTLTDVDFRRLHLNQWTAPEDRLTSRSEVLACVGHEGVLEPVAGVRYVASLDLGLKNDRSCLTVSHLEERDARRVVVVDRQEVWAGSRARPVELAEVEAVVFEAARAYRCPVYVDPWQSAQMAQALRRRGVKVVDFTFSQSSNGRLAVTLYRLLKDGLLDLPADDDLTDELAAVRLIERSPGVYRLDHDDDAHDDRAVSLALGAHQLLSRPTRGRLHFTGAM